MEKYIVFDIETTGLNPAFYDEITCICAKDSNGNEIQIIQDKEINYFEQDMILDFLEWLGDRKNAFKILVTCNGIDFDIPFILQRMLRLGIMPKKDHIFLSFKQIDIQRLTSKKVSLDDMAILLKCSRKSGKGEDAIKLFKEKKIFRSKKILQSRCESYRGNIFEDWKHL